MSEATGPLCYMRESCCSLCSMRGSSQPRTGSLYQLSLDNHARGTIGFAHVPHHLPSSYTNAAHRLRRQRTLTGSATYNHRKEGQS